MNPVRKPIPMSGVHRPKARATALALCLLASAAGCAFWGGDRRPQFSHVWGNRPDSPQSLNGHEPRRLNNLSPWYAVREEDVELQASYCGWDTQSERRVEHLNIHTKAKQMIADADRFIVATVFLFDNLYGDAPPSRDIVAEFTELMLEKKRKHPEMPVVLILDQMHKAWGDRKSPAVEKLRAAGVDVFYSDVHDTMAATRLPVYENAMETWDHLDGLTGGGMGRVMDVLLKAPVPFVSRKFDGERIRLETVAQAAVFKANHRKLLVTAKGAELEALATSANPHNASIPNENYSVTVKGPLAAYIYMVQREDVKRSIERGADYCDWSDSSEGYREAFLTARLPPLPDADYRPPERPGADQGVHVAFASEEAIEAGVLAMLDGVGPGDEVRIQMFYLSRPPVIDAVLDAAMRTRQPVRLLLDPNRVGLGYPKDGTPNSQVATYMLDRARREKLNLEIRWYSTHGEQNHAKIMSVTNPRTGKYELTTGSANWTRKNLAGINLESGLFVVGSRKLNGAFDELFDKLWSNGDAGIQYSVAWDDPRHNYHKHAGMSRWAPRSLFGLGPLKNENERPARVEKELVHW